jgi:hypothetical protein
MSIDFGSPMSIDHDLRPGSPMSLCGAPDITAHFWPECYRSFTPESIVTVLDETTTVTSTPETATKCSSKSTNAGSLNLAHPKRDGPIPTGPKSKVQHSFGKKPTEPKTATQDPIGRMLARGPPPNQRKKAGVRKHITQERSNGNTTSLKPMLERGEDRPMTDEDWDAWKTSQARWIENRRRNNAKRSRWQRRTPQPNGRLPKWVKQRPGL